MTACIDTKFIFALFFTIFFNFSIHCMEEAITEKNDDRVSLIEQLSDDVLILIFNQRINDILNTVSRDQRKKEFEALLYSICFACKRFHKLGGRLKKYFDENNNYPIEELRNMIFGKLDYYWNEQC